MSENTIDDALRFLGFDDTLPRDIAARALNHVAKVALRHGGASMIPRAEVEEEMRSFKDAITSWVARRWRLCMWLTMHPTHQREEAARIVAIEGLRAGAPKLEDDRVMLAALSMPELEAVLADADDVLRCGEAANTAIN